MHEHCHEPRQSYYYVKHKTSKDLAMHKLPHIPYRIVHLLNMTTCPAPLPQKHT